jgi:phosphoribosyl 1,2-cyclic phosphodiesterase
MRLKVLGSGSSGNCYILENESEALIIEAGLPFMEVKKALNFNVMKIVGVVVSHIHGDHAKYIPEYKKAGIPVFQPYEDYYMKRKYGNFKVFPFSLVHDVECYGFWIWHTEIGRLVYASDTEYVRWRFYKTTHLLVETNYDMQFVDRDEPNYEHRLRGHMSLDTALKFISTNDNPALRNVVLIHLSDKSGDPALFKQKTEETVKYGSDVYVAERGLEVDMNLYPF